MLIYAARAENNNGFFRDILRLYVPEGSAVADLTWGRGSFWVGIDRSKYKLIRLDKHTPCDVKADFRAVPLADEAQDAVVFDPPYVTRMSFKARTKDNPAGSNQKDAFGNSQGASAAWVAARVPFWGRSRGLRAMITRLRRSLEPSHEEQVEKSDTASSGSVKVLLQRVEAADRHYTKTYSSYLPEVYGTTASVLDGRSELFLIKGQIICALYHYQIRHPVTVPIGFISNAPDLLAVGERMLASLTRPPARVTMLSRGAPGTENVAGKKTSSGAVVPQLFL